MLTAIPSGDFDVCYGTVVQRVTFNRWCIGSHRGMMNLKDAIAYMMHLIENREGRSLDADQ